MSENDSVHGYPSQLVLDVEKLISEVEKRPALYNRNAKEYSDRNLKGGLWTEVCAAVLKNWNGLSVTERLIKGKEVQKKWKNLKDSFAKELARQKQSSSGQVGKKRRRYLHFESLLFLIPCIEDRPTSSKISSPTKVTNESAATPGEIGATVEDTQRRRAARESLKPTSHDLLQTSKEKRNEDIDEDKSFALMLVPMLKKLNEDEKHFAKVEILNVMQRARLGMIFMNTSTPIFIPSAQCFQQEQVTPHCYSFNPKQPQIPESSAPSQNRDTLNARRCNSILPHDISEDYDTSINSPSSSDSTYTLWNQ